MSAEHDPAVDGAIQSAIQISKQVAKKVWETFYTATLGRSLSTRPTGEDILRHLLELPNVLQTRSETGDHAPVAHTVIASHLAALLQHLHVEYQGFKLTVAEQECLKAAFQTLSRDGEMK